MTPPGPGIAPTSGERISRRIPTANKDHSTAGWSKKRRHCRLPDMCIDVVIQLRACKRLRIASASV
jgi:hypothetical protein